jgi:hypothetical protein
VTVEKIDSFMSGRGGNEPQAIIGSFGQKPASVMQNHTQV